MSVIFGDYVAGFLGLGRDGSSWSMNPFDVSTKTPGGDNILNIFSYSPSRKTTGPKLGEVKAINVPWSSTFSTECVCQLNHQAIFN